MLSFVVLVAVSRISCALIYAMEYVLYSFRGLSPLTWAGIYRPLPDE